MFVMVTRKEIEKLNLKRNCPIEYKINEIDSLPQLGYFQYLRKKDEGDTLYVTIPTSHRVCSRLIGKYLLSILESVTKLQRVE